MSWRLAAVKFRVRFSRGRSLVFWGWELVLAALAMKAYGLPLWLLPVFAVATLVGFYVLGYADEHWGILKTEVEYGFWKLNPRLDNALPEKKRGGVR